MKKTILKSVMIGALSIFMVTSSFAQTKKNSKVIEKVKVPKAVTEEFIRECPIVESDTWYGYPFLSNQLEWYDYNPSYYTCENPEYYEVHYVKDKIPHKAVYTKEGKKVATHHQVKTDLVPLAVKTSLVNGAYKAWKETGEKVEIEKVTTNEKVYKITVEKEGKKHHLFYDAAGKLLKDETVASK